jgi:KDO2-lipid IV(A) lauroyltransferase
MKIFQPRRHSLDFKWHEFLAPRFWPTWLLFVVLRLAVLLPYGGLLRVGRALGYIAMKVLKKRRKIAEINLRLCFPELTEDQRQKLLIENFAASGMGFLEMALAWWGSDKRLKKLCVAQGLENLDLAKQKDVGVLLVTGHFTSIELCIRLLSFYTPICVMYRPQNNKLFEWMLQRARRHYVVEGIERYDIRGMLRRLKNKDVVCYTPDQDYGSDNNSVFAPLFGNLANTVTGTARFARHTGAIILPTFYWRNLNTKKYYIDFQPSLRNYPVTNEMENATRINQIIELAIRQHPEQYMWQHRRFKTASAGEEAPY